MISLTGAPFIKLDATFTSSSRLKSASSLLPAGVAAAAGEAIALVGGGGACRPRSPRGGVWRRSAAERGRHSASATATQMVRSSATARPFLSRERRCHADGSALTQLKTKL